MTNLEQFLLMLDNAKIEYTKDIGEDIQVWLQENHEYPVCFCFELVSGKLIEII